MIDRVKLALTESCVGTIALGWLLADGIMQLVGALAAPLGDWVTRKEFPRVTEVAGGPTTVSFESALLGLVRFLLILLIWYVLLRWLYFRPSNTKTAQ